MEAYIVKKKPNRADGPKKRPISNGFDACKTIPKKYMYIDKHIKNYPHEE
jgi:hypothetical protein